MGNPVTFGLIGGTGHHLCSSFLVIFSFCGNLDITIFDLTNSGWNLAFSCSLSPVELEQWHKLDATFLTLSEILDSVV